MKKNVRWLMFTLLITLLLVLAIGCNKSPNVPENGQADTREVVDLAGRNVTVPAEINKVATMQGPNYEMVFMLGAKDQIGLVRDDHPTAYPLATLTNPDLVNYPVISGVGPQSPVNVEEFISKGVDLVIYWNIPQELEKFEKADIPVVVLSESGTKVESIEDTISDYKRQLSFLADLMGGNAVEKYAEWEKYLDKTVETIKSRTADIPEDERPVVYWGNTWDSNILSTYPLNPRVYEVALCGGKLVSVNKGGQFPKITKEQLLAWQPEVILVDNHGRNPEQVIEELNTNADWASLPAVKNERLYRLPAGVFFLDKGSTKPLYYYWLSQQLHPELFADIDMVKEVKYYYETFYDYEMSDEQAKKLLAGWVEGI